MKGGVVNTDWCWLQRDADIPIIPNSQMGNAYSYVVGDFVPRLQAANIPIDFVFCPETGTTNVAVEKKYIDHVWEIIFKDAGFVEKQIPLKDAMAQADLKEALMRGSNFNRFWT